MYVDYHQVPSTPSAPTCGAGNSGTAVRCSAAALPPTGSPLRWTRTMSSTPGSGQQEAALSEVKAPIPACGPARPPALGLLRGSEEGCERCCGSAYTRIWSR